MQDYWFDFALNFLTKLFPLQQLTKYFFTKEISNKMPLPTPKKIILCTPFLRLLILRLGTNLYCRHKSKHFSENKYQYLQGMYISLNDVKVPMELYEKIIM